jgi:hypothetical protein
MPKGETKERTPEGEERECACRGCGGGRQEALEADRCGAPPFMHFSVFAYVLVSVV